MTGTRFLLVMGGGIVRGGHMAGLRTVLVTSGVDDERTACQKGVEPDLVVSGLHMLVDLWEKEHDAGSLSRT